VGRRTAAVSYLRDVTSLPDIISAQIIAAFGIPPGWKADARDAALTGLLTSCRESSWAVDPTTSYDLISTARSSIFRISEQLQERKRAPATERAEHFLTGAEQADLSAMLALTGKTLADIECVGGRWQLRAQGGSGGGGPAVVQAPAQPLEATAEQVALERQIRTLKVEVFPLLTADERKDQANRAKALAGRKRAAAFPGDSETDAEDVSFNPFSEYPWEQSLMFEPSYSYSLCGRILRNALRWHNRNFTDGLARMTWKSHETTTTELYSQFKTAVADRRHDTALLVATHAVAEATVQMTAIDTDAKLNASRFPQSALLAHIATRRSAQVLELKVFLADIAQRITEATKGESSSALAMASWIDFLEGWLTKVDKSLVSSESLLLASPTAAVAAGSASLGVTGLGGGGSANKAARTLSTGGSGGGGSSSSPGSMGPPQPGRSKLSRICVFQQHIPLSPDIVGDHLGVAGAPFCTKCRRGNHYFGECPVEWGKIGKPLPGFVDDGTRIDKAWCQNEPIKSTVKLWVKFLQDKANFNNNDPIVAGVDGAPGLAEFQGRVDTAPAKK